MASEPGSPESSEESARSAAELAEGGLPLEATARLDQLRRTGSWTSDLTVDEFAAVRDVGFDPVGQVMGSTVDQIGYSGGGGCGALSSSLSGGGLFGPSLQVSPPGIAGPGGTGTSRWVGYGDYVRAMYAARRRAMSRLGQECAALGGDGVVGVHLTITGFPGIAHALEFQAIGTAVRARGRHHPPRPFMSDLSGQDFAKLIRAGWVPCGLVFGVAVGVRHDDYQTRGVVRSWQNAEVPGYTELVESVRAECRVEIEADVARHGGAGVVVRKIALRVWEQPCQSVGQMRDHVAEATIVGTAVAPFAPPTRRLASALRIFRLDQRHEAVVGTRLTDEEVASP